MVLPNEAIGRGDNILAAEDNHRRLLLYHEQSCRRKKGMDW